jgi:23S rRNA pseudouridine955/2504/2580 synthase
LIEQGCTIEWIKRFQGKNFEIRRWMSTGLESENAGGGTVLRAGPAFPTRLDRFLAEQRPNVAFSFVQKLIRTRRVRIQDTNGAWIRETDCAHRLQEGQLVQVHSSLYAEDQGPELGSAYSPTILPIRDIQRVRDAVLFENKDCVVINKPSGIAVQGGSKIPKGKHLDAWIQHAFGGSPGEDKHMQKPRLVHRLDRETSGCLVVAKTREAAATLASAFQEGRVEKMYIALVAGHIEGETGLCLYFLLVSMHCCTAL